MTASTICYPINSVVIYKTENNGFIVNIKGTYGQQCDKIDGIFVFTDLSDLTDYIKEYYSR